MSRQAGRAPALRLALGLTCCAWALAGCVQRFQPRTDRPAITLQWPYAPAKAKLSYVQSITGFASVKSAGSTVKSLVTGQQKNNDAFVLPVAVAVGKDGRMVVADTGRRCAHYYLPAAQRYLKLVGTKQDRLVSPVGVAFDDADEPRLWVSDSSGKVFAFGPDGTPAYVLKSAGPDALQRPTGLAWSPRRKWLYVVDTAASRIHAFEADGTYVRSFGSRGDGEGAFNFPTHIFRSAAGELYLTDALNFRVVVLDEMGTVLGAFGHQGDGSGDLGLPKGLAVDGDGIVYVVDALFDNVQLFRRQGDFLLTVGRRGTDMGEFWLPAGAFIGYGKLYVCDAYNRRVQVFRIAEGYENESAR